MKFVQSVVNLQIIWQSNGVLTPETKFKFGSLIQPTGNVAIKTTRDDVVTSKVAVRELNVSSDTPLVSATAISSVIVVIILLALNTT